MEVSLSDKVATALDQWIVTSFRQVALCLGLLSVLWCITYWERLRKVAPLARKWKLGRVFFRRSLERFTNGKEVSRQSAITTRWRVLPIHWRCRNQGCLRTSAWFRPFRPTYGPLRIINVASGPAEPSCYNLGICLSRTETPDQLHYGLSIPISKDTDAANFKFQ